jgi:hypothetical protein
MEGGECDGKETEEQMTYLEEGCWVLLRWLKTALWLEVEIDELIGRRSARCDRKKIVVGRRLKV